MVRTDRVEAVQQAAEDRLGRMGMEDTKVLVLQAQMRELRDHGFLADLDVKGLSMFATRVDWYLDLGVPRGDSRRSQKRLSPGRKQLLPDNILRSLETQLRRNLDKFGRRITAFGSYRWIPDSAFEEWLEKHDELLAKWEAEKQRIIDNYGTLRDEAETDFRTQAADTWAQLIGRAQAEEENGETAHWLRQRNRESFISEVVYLAKSKMPSEYRIQEEVKVALRPATFMMSEEMAADQLEATKLNVEKQMEWDKLSYHQRRAMAEAETAEAEQHAMQEESAQRVRVAREEATLEIATSRAGAEALMAEKRRLAVEAAQEMMSPFQEVVEGLRSEILGGVREVLAGVQKHGHVRGKAVEKVRNIVDTFKLLNMAGDDELELAINNLESSLSAPGMGTKRDTGAITSALREVAGIALKEAEEVADLTEFDEWLMLEV